MANAGTIRQYTELARIIPICCGCRAPADDTIRLAHRNFNTWGTLFGRSTKSMALSGAFLCMECDQYYSEGPGRDDHEFWEYAVQRSQTFAYQDGYLRFEPKGGDPDTRIR